MRMEAGVGTPQQPRLGVRLCRDSRSDRPQTSSGSKPGVKCSAERTGALAEYVTVSSRGSCTGDETGQRDI